MKKQRLLFIFFIAVLLLCWSAALVSAFTLPDTGQTKCYGRFGIEIASCVGTGQDGAYNINPMSYTDNGNGTVTDDITGLMWQKEDDNTSRNWAAAVIYCDSLTLGGQSDWRLPARKELMSLVDYSIPYPGPTISTPYFLNTNAGGYWSSTIYADNIITYYVWYLYFFNGSVGYFDKFSSYYVRCVRGGQSGSLCDLTIPPSSQTFTSSAATDSVTVTASVSSCAWTASSTLSWVTITSGSSGTGNGTVTISVSANTTGATRTGNITIAGQTFTITQSAGSQTVLLVTTPSQTYFDTIQAAYAAAVSGSSILVQGTTLTEALVFNQHNTLTLTGGYDSSFSAVGGIMTTVQGSLTVSGGTLTVANIVLQ